MVYGGLWLYLDGGEEKEEGHDELEKGGHECGGTHGNEDAENDVQVVESRRSAEESVDLVEEVIGSGERGILPLLEPTVENPTTRRQCPNPTKLEEKEEGRVQ